MKVATIDNVKVGDEVWIKSKVLGINIDDSFPIITNECTFSVDGKVFDGDTEPCLFIAETEFKPRMMKVWDESESNSSVKMVVGIFKGQYIIEYADGSYTIYKNACEITEPTTKIDIPESKLEAVKKLLAE